MSGYCKPTEHAWVQVVGGQGYDPDFDTQVCIKCQCYQGIRRNHPARPPHPATQIGRQ